MVLIISVFATSCVSAIFSSIQSNIFYRISSGYYFSFKTLPGYFVSTHTPYFFLASESIRGVVSLIYNILIRSDLMYTSNLSLIFNKIDPAGVYLLTSINTLKFNTLIFLFISRHAYLVCSNFTIYVIALSLILSQNLADLTRHLVRLIVLGRGGFNFLCYIH